MFKNNNATIRWLSGIWEGLVESAHIEDARNRHLSRILNIVLLLLLTWGMTTEIQHILENRFSSAGSSIVIIMLVILGLAYYLNRKGYFLQATILTLGLFISATFVSAVIRNWKADVDFSVLYYLIIAILLSEFFLSMQGYLITVFIILAGVLGISLLNSNAGMVFAFLFAFSALIGFSSYNRRAIEKEQIELAGKITHEQSLLSMEQRRTAQLGLLEEVGRQIANSLDEREILQCSLQAVVDKFGYAEAAISLLVNEDVLEVAAINGTLDFGYQPGYQQKMGKGIIGHVAKTRKHHVTGDVSRDPYYFSTAERHGSALGIPMLDKDDLLGVIYVEATAQNHFKPDDVQTIQTLANQVATSLQKARLYARTQEHLQVMTTLQSVSQVVTSSLELDEILHNVVKLLKESFGYTYISIYLLKDDVLHLGTEMGYPKNMIIYDIPVTSGVAGRTVLSKQTQFIPDVSKDPNFLRASYEVKSEICVPLLKKGHVLGVLNVESKDQIPLGERDLNLLNALAGPIAIAIDNARLHAQVKALAMTDAVSGLFNRHAFEELLTAEVQRAIRYGHHLSLIIFDLDSFKEYNDAWGHPAGDVRLRGIADLIRANQRKHDIAARYGGDEFAIILPNTDKEGAHQFAKRLLEAAQASTTEEPTDGRGVPGYTLSLGLATFPQDGDTLAALLLAADQAELLAKRLGKNRIISAGNTRHP